jgi:hypothetical protein
MSLPFHQSASIKARAAALCLLLLLHLTMPRAVAAQAQSNDVPVQTAVSPEEVVQQFYRWYLHALNGNKQPLKQGAMLHKYVTRGTIQAVKKAEQAGELDADWFLDAQDFNFEWERNIETSKATVRAGTATLLLTLGGGEWTHKLKITLKREDKVWKIANALSANP